MDSVRRAKLLAKPEVKTVADELAQKLREELPASDFTELEEMALVATGEAVRGVLDDKLQRIADGFPGRLVIDGVGGRAGRRGDTRATGQAHCRTS